MECGECTLCCKLPDMNSPRGTYCDKCIQNSAEGCSIYQDRPEQCKIFKCMYAQMEKAGIKLRPDKCKVMFEKISDDLILATTDDKIDNINEIVKGQIESFRINGFSVMLQQFNPHKFICMMTKGADRDKIAKQLEEKSNDSS